MACLGCGETVAQGARYCSVCGREVMVGTVAPPPATQTLSGRAALEGLYRPRENRMIAGVCAGFAQRYGWDVAIVRLVLVLSVFFGAGVPLLAYLVGWVVMPNGQYSLPVRASASGPGSMRV